VLHRQELTRGAMIRTLARHPWMTVRIASGIYWQALQLWRKGFPFYPHPQYAARTESSKP
jgi:DUF1365 family protein